MSGEDDRPTLRFELRPHAQAFLVGLTAAQLRVDRLHEGVHAIETFRSGSGRQPFEITVRTRDVAVRAGADVHDDVSALPHEYGKNSSLPSGSSIWSTSFPHQDSLVGTERLTSSRRRSVSPSAVSSMNRRALSLRGASSQRMIAHSPWL